MRYRIAPYGPTPNPAVHGGHLSALAEDFQLTQRLKPLIQRWSRRPAQSHPARHSSDLESLLASIEQKVDEPSRRHLRLELRQLEDKPRIRYLSRGRSCRAIAAGASLGHRRARSTLVPAQNPIARFHNTFRVVFTMVFGTADQAFRPPALASPRCTPHPRRDSVPHRWLRTRFRYYAS